MRMPQERSTLSSATMTKNAGSVTVTLASPRSSALSSLSAP